jgi:hypothetical protein
LPSRRAPDRGSGYVVNCRRPQSLVVSQRIHRRFKAGHRRTSLPFAQKRDQASPIEIPCLQAGRTASSSRPQGERRNWHGQAPIGVSLAKVPTMCVPSMFLSSCDRRPRATNNAANLPFAIFASIGSVEIGSSINCGRSVGTIEYPAKPRISAPRIVATIAAEGPTWVDPAELTTRRDITRSNYDG